MNPVAIPSIRRNRRGRGLRGPLAPSDVPIARTRAQRFDEMVLEAVEQTDAKWRRELAKVEFAVEDVPSLDDWTHDWVPMARAFAGTGVLPARVVVYRRPLESRAAAPEHLRALVAAVVTEQVAELFGDGPDDIAT